MLVNEFLLKPILLASAQVGENFSSGSDGSDGALILTTPGTVYTFQDPCSEVIPAGPVSDNVCHFTTIQIGSGVTVKLSGQYLDGPVYWLASGAVQIDGTIDLNGEDGHVPPTVLTDRKPSVPGAGGFAGGAGQTSTSLAQPGSGPGGGGAASGSGDNGGGAGFGGYGTDTTGSADQGIPYGNDFLVPLVGGSGGGGGGYNGTLPGSGGGAGGGGLLIASSVSISVNGTIQANGGKDGPVTTGQRGGGGSGGAIHLLSPVINGAGTLSATGGNSGANSTTGSVGRIRLEAFTQAFSGTVTPAAKFSVPTNVFLPPAPPEVRVVSVNTGTGIIPVPEHPTGDFTLPDVTISAGTTITLNLSAHNIPLGTTVQLIIYSENLGDQVVNSTPLAGTLANSSAVIVTTIPYGASRLALRSDYDNLFYPEQRYAVGDNPMAITAANFNGGQLDLAVTNWTSNFISVLLGSGSGDGTFQPATSYGNVSTTGYDIATGDLDNNGTLDIVLARFTATFFYILKGNGNGTFQPATNFVVTSTPRSLILVDFNTDGNLDIALTLANNTVPIYFGTGDGSFQYQQTYSVGTDPYKLVYGDLNEDGNLDLVTGNPSSDDISILFGNGGGTFQTQRRYPMHDGPAGVALGDLNNDGHLDIVAANYHSDDISVRLGYGNGFFGSEQRYAVGDGPAWVSIADFDGDGNLDLVISENNTDHILILLGSPYGTFQIQQRYPVGDFPHWGTVADFNGDGKIDVAVPNELSDDISVLLHR
jgi:hypothetical protein